MSVNPGFGGQSFIPATLDKAREARKLIDESGYDITLEIDVRLACAHMCLRAHRRLCQPCAGACMWVRPRLTMARPAGTASRM